MPSVSNEEPLLTVRKVAIICSVTNYTVRLWLKSGQLKGVKLGDSTRWRIKQEDLENFVNTKYGDNK